MVSQEVSNIGFITAHGYNEGHIADWFLRKGGVKMKIICKNFLIKMKHFVCFGEIFLVYIKVLNYIRRVQVKDKSLSWQVRCVCCRSNWKLAQWGIPGWCKCDIKGSQILSGNLSQIIGLMLTRYQFATNDPIANQWMIGAISCTYDCIIRLEQTDELHNIHSMIFFFNLIDYPSALPLEMPSPTIPRCRIHRYV